MKIYLVGGAVRDKLMGLPVSDRDYVVTGSSVSEMLSLGYKQVGADFPVFIHPETGEEYALARQERKTGQGYLGFEAIFDENTTLEDDLRRRDLTINAMALDLDTNEIIDPFNGQESIERRYLIHTSDAFDEDPVRVLRTARFAARYGFGIDLKTIIKCEQLGKSGELSFLTKERVFKEVEKSIKDGHFDIFILALWQMSVLNILFPEIYALMDIPAGPQAYHGEGDTFNHTIMVIKEVSKHNIPLATFGALVHDLGKVVTKRDILPSHPGHEDAGVSIVIDLCNRLKTPSSYRRTGVLCTKHHGHVHKAMEMNPKSFVNIYKDFNKGFFEHDLDVLIKVAEADHYGRISIDNAREKGYPQAQVFAKVLTAVHSYRLSQEISVDEIKSMNAERVQQMAHMGRCRAARRALAAAKNDLKIC